LENAGERAYQGDFQSIEDPGRAEGDDDAHVPTGPREPVHPSGDV